MRIVGIDGGGTGTKLEIRDENNQVIGRRKYGAFNIYSIGEEKFRLLIREIGTQETMSEWDALCIGGAGVSYAGIESILREELAGCGFRGKFRLCNDAVIALRGAIDGPGCILIAGTGTIGYGTDGQRIARVGGWGHLIDDPGSGYALGRDALSAAARHLDGRLKAESLCRTVLAAVGGTAMSDILLYIRDAATDKAKIAAIAPCVLQCAEQGDPVSLDILRRNAEELKKIISALGNRLDLPCPRTALLGGLMTEGNVYRRITEEVVGSQAEIVPAAHDALWGAAQLAWEMR